MCVILVLYKSFQKISKRLVVFKSLCYDLDVGRIIIDDISYLDPETINGINLYAYCGNNPVMRIDENGAPVVWYKYDALNRLIREDNKSFGKTWLYR